MVLSVETTFSWDNNNDQEVEMIEVESAGCVFSEGYVPEVNVGIVDKISLVKTIA